jgi:PhzF family phenazine biosynthesis protein
MNQIIQIAAFSSNGKGGNSAGLVWPADHLNPSQRQAIATRAGYSETAFVERVSKDRLRLEYYTPSRQIEICGHATVATYSYLRDIGEVDLGLHNFESAIGLHQVEVRSDKVGLWQEQLDYKKIADGLMLERVSKSLNLKSNLLLESLQIASNGAPFLLIAIDDVASLKKIIPNQEEILKTSEALKIVGYYLYTLHDQNKIEARMFAPAYGILEESATGMAAGALALSLNRELAVDKFIIKQGHLMSKPSPALLYAEVFDNRRTLILGESVMVDRIDLTEPSCFLSKG